jgi:hypothetical protein
MLLLRVQSVPRLIPCELSITSILRSTNQTALPVRPLDANGWQRPTVSLLPLSQFQTENRPGDLKGSGRLAQPLIRTGVLDGGVGSHLFARNTGSMASSFSACRSLLPDDKGTKGPASCSRQRIAMYVCMCVCMYVPSPHSLDRVQYIYDTRSSCSLLCTYSIKGVQYSVLVHMYICTSSSRAPRDSLYRQPGLCRHGAIDVAARGSNVLSGRRQYVCTDKMRRADGAPSPAAFCPFALGPRVAHFMYVLCTSAIYVAVSIPPRCPREAPVPNLAAESPGEAKR